MVENDVPAAGGRPEQETLMEERVKIEKKSRMRNFSDFLYDRTSGKVLGRSGISWLEITVFYIIFYACLAAFWATCLAVFVHTLSPDEPRYYGKGSIIGVNPGMGYQPWLSKDPESTLIHFNLSDPESYEKYVKQMKEFLKKYDKKEKTRKCDGAGQNNSKGEELSCEFDLESQLYSHGCGPKDDYGFKHGKPCVIITLNRLIGWEPVTYPKDSAPEVVRDRYSYDKGDIAIDCEGEYYADQENMGTPKYIPPSGLGRQYYPFTVKKNYHQPIAMVQFEHARTGILMEIECKAYAYNIIHDRSDRQGMVHFELLVDM